MPFPYEQMRLARQAKNITMRQLGNMLDPPVKERTVHMWETGKYAPKSPRREQILHLLDMQDVIAEAPVPLPPIQTGTVGMPRAELVTTLLAIRSELDGILSRI